MTEQAPPKRTTILGKLLTLGLAGLIAFGYYSAGRVDQGLTFRGDMNLDGFVTISDLWHWFKWVLLLPGDGLISLLLERMPAVAIFFELDRSDLLGWPSAVLSLFGWWLIYAVAASSSDDQGA